MALNPVARLTQLGLQALMEPLVSVMTVQLSVSEDEDAWPDVAVVREYLEAAPAPLMQDLLQVLLARTDLAPDVRYCAVRLLLRPDTASLSVGMFPDPFHAQLVRAIGQLGRGLQSLDMKGVWLRDDNMREFCSALPGLPRLRVLGIPHVATDELLEAASRHCPKLHALDVSGETHISRQGLQALADSAALQIVDIGNLAEMTVSPADIAFLIESLPNLISLGTYSYVGRALVQLTERGWKGTTKLEYLHDIGTTPHAMVAMRQLCPALASVYLDGADEGVVADLRHFPRLTEIKLHIFSSAELMELLEASGGHVDSLELLFGSGTLDLSRLASLCGALTKLECYFVACTDSGAVPLPCLRSVGIFQSAVSTHTVLALTLGAPLLARLGVGSALDLSDGDVADLCGPELKEVWLHGARRLTQEAVVCFITGCPKLTSLGELSGWNVRPQEVHELRVMSVRSNLDLKLWYCPGNGGSEADEM